MKFSKTALVHGLVYSLVDLLSWFFIETFDGVISYGMMGVPFTIIFFLTLLMEKRASKKLFFTQPPAFFSIFTMLYIYLSYFLVIYFGEVVIFITTGTDEIYYVKTLLLTNVGVHALWVSFRLFTSVSIPVDKLGTYAFIRKRYLLAIIITAVFANIIGVRLGAIGYVNRGGDAVESTAGFAQYIRILMDLSYLGFVSLTWFYYDNKKYRPLVIGVFVFLFLLGLLIGSKSVSVFYAIYFGLVIYFKTFKVNYKFILIFFFSIFVAYSIIEPFRNHYGKTGRSFSTNNILELASFYQEALSSESDKKDEGSEVIALSVLSRLSYTIPLAKAMKYADENNHYVPPDAEPRHILLAPLYSFIPRFIWRSKPFADFSVWVGREVMNKSEASLTAVGITAQGYCYMAGGYILVIVVFLFIGLTQKVIYNTFYMNPNYTPLYIFLLLRIHTFDPLIWAAYANLTRTILIYFLLYYVITTKLRIVK
jgi:hypothetical protein